MSNSSHPENNKAMTHYNQKIYCLILFLCMVGTVSAQKAERDYLRKGNRAYKKESYVEAEVSYRKAIEVSPFSAESLYNLGNSLALQGKDKEALEAYAKAAERTQNPNKLSSIYHNTGDLYMASQNYPAAIEAFKESLRKDPTNDMTRYNLALAQKLLKENPPQEQEQEEQQQDQNKDEQDQQEQDQNKDQKDNEAPQEEDRKDKMSQENAEQLLKAAMQDEQRLREQMKQEVPAQGGRPEKDW